MFWYGLYVKLNMRHPFQLSGSFEIHKNGDLFLNEKRVELLRQVGSNGSINAASKAMKMSYQQAWHFIKEMNELSPLPLIVRQRGGSNGGGAELTRYAQKMITMYEQIGTDFEEFKLEKKKQVIKNFF